MNMPIWERVLAFTGAKSGVITVNSALGVYHLMRSEIPKRSASIMEWKMAGGEPQKSSQPLLTSVFSNEE
ncbi:MAG: hypothetical protein ACI9R3_000096 [Verrucomicrobiales bacterium]|jgi:hypothetical protein